MTSNSENDTDAVSDQYPVLSKSFEENDSQNKETITLAKDSQVQNSSTSKVTIKSCSKSVEGKKLWDKKHYCVYCEKAFAKLPRHLESIHKHELDVIKLRSLDRRVKEQCVARNKIIDALRKKGDYSHNLRVLESDHGEVVTKKSLSKVKDNDAYLPCQHCLGFYLKVDLYRHVQRCSVVGELSNSTRHQSKSALLLPCLLDQDMSQEFK